MPFACRPVELDFVEKAPWRFENIAEIDAKPEAVFDTFADGESWPKWFDGIRRVEWTSPEPKGVGTTRTVTLTMVTVHEYFLVWDRGRRFTFRFTGASLPLFAAGIEDYRLEPIGSDRTRFTYGVYAEPTLTTRATSVVSKVMFARMFRKAAEGLRGHFAGRSR